VARMGHSKAIWAIAHRLCRITWKILHQGVRYEERGPRFNPKADHRRATSLVRQLRQLGYAVNLTPLNPGA